MQLRPIETCYNNYRFRSRLEARWAVYFDTMGIEYEYEKEGYDLDGVGYYLPDFWLPQVNMWAEVKSDIFSKDAEDKVLRLARTTQYPVIMLEGQPDYITYRLALPSWSITDCILSNYNGYMTNEHRFYVSTEFYKKPKSVMHVGVYNLDGETIKKGVVAARSARFEHEERTDAPIRVIKRSVTINLDQYAKYTETRLKQECEKIEREYTYKEIERKREEERLAERNRYLDGNHKLTKSDVIRYVMENEHQISPEAVDFILSSEKPNMLLKKLLEKITADVIVINPEDITNICTCQ